MAALFALGVMSVAWMAFVAALIALEKLAPWRAAANLGIAVGLLAVGIGLAAAPSSVPALTVPGSSSANRAMMKMDGGGKMKMHSGGAMPKRGGAMPKRGGAMPKRGGTMPKRGGAMPKGGQAMPERPAPARAMP